MIHGPGCPVRVLQIALIDLAIGLALQHQVTLCSYGDCLRMPVALGLSLFKAEAQGADVRMVEPNPAIIGDVIENSHAFVQMTTRCIGGRRILDG
jgi:hydrogenase expression/formation protein HypD